MLEAFDELFDVAAGKIQAAFTPAERAEARERFSQRFAQVLELTRAVELPGVPADVMTAMKAQVNGLSSADLAGLIAAVPLAQQTQEMLRTLAYRDAERKLLEHLVAQADTRYGGN